MGRRLGLTAVLLGLVASVAAVAGIVEGRLALAAGWRPFLLALVGFVVGVALVAWGGVQYADVGARL